MPQQCKERCLDEFYTPDTIYWGCHENDEIDDDDDDDDDTNTNQLEQTPTSPLTHFPQNK